MAGDGSAVPAPTAAAKRSNSWTWGTGSPISSARLAATSSPGSAFGERIDKAPEEAGEEVFEMAVLGCVIGELGDGYLALAPALVERVVK